MRSLVFVFLGIPLEQSSERLQRGSFYVRNIIGASEEHGAIAVGHRPNVGDKVGFVLRDAERSRSTFSASALRTASSFCCSARSMASR